MNNETQYLHIYKNKYSSKSVLVLQSLRVFRIVAKYISDHYLRFNSYILVTADSNRS
jgi:hypothetical protein